MELLVLVGCKDVRCVHTACSNQADSFDMIKQAQDARLMRVLAGCRKHVPQSRLNRQCDNERSKTGRQ